MINKISEALSEKMENENTIYVLKGFNSIISKLKISIDHIFDLKIIENLTNILEVDKRYLTKEFQKLNESGKKFYCLFEEMLYIEKRFNIPYLTDYNITVINLNCFDYYYPGLIGSYNEECLKIFNEEKSEINELQKIYTEFEIRNGTPIIAYNILEEEYNEIQFITCYTDDYYFYNHKDEKSIILYDNSVSEIFIQIFNDICEGKYNTITYIKIEEKNNATIKKYLSILNQFEINIVVEKEQISHEKPELYDEYLKILYKKIQNLILKI